MAGTSANGGGSGFGGGNDGFASDWKLKVIWLLVTIIAGGGGAAGYFTANPPRPDPFTGTEGKALSARITSLELRQAKDDDHREESKNGFARIRQLEREMTAHEERIIQCYRLLDKVK